MKNFWRIVTVPSEEMLKTKYELMHNFVRISRTKTISLYTILAGRIHN